ncbi:hypothetical protein FGB62_7g447 [Gracilaria domingensis]|nr:hypothetical protein FGB62_7g447 [Gracilaria domingensis]
MRRRREQSGLAFENEVQNDNERRQPQVQRAAHGASPSPTVLRGAACCATAVRMRMIGWQTDTGCGGCVAFGRHGRWTRAVDKSLAPVCGGALPQHLDCDGRLRLSGGRWRSACGLRRLSGSPFPSSPVSRRRGFSGSRGCANELAGSPVWAEVETSPAGVVARTRLLARLARSSFANF